MRISITCKILDSRSSNSTIAGTKCEYLFAAVSSRGLLALLLCWSSQRKHAGRIEHIADSAEAMLRRLLAELPAAMTLQVSLADDIEATPTGIQADGQLASVAVADGEIDLAGCTFTDRWLMQSFPGVFDKREEIADLHGLLCAAPLLQPQNGAWGFVCLPQLH